MFIKRIPPSVTLSARLGFRPIAALALLSALFFAARADAQLTRPQPPRGLTIVSANLDAPAPVVSVTGPTASPTCTPDTFTATLTGAQEVPPNSSTATGSATVTLDRDPGTSTITVNLTFDGLSGPAGAAHIHGPALPGTTAPIIIPFPNFPAAISGTYSNTFPISPEQVMDLLNGLLYVNIHTASFPSGEIRGQLLGNCGPNPSPTGTASASATGTPNASATPTGTASGSPTATATGTPNASVTATGTASGTPSATATGTPNASGTPHASATATASGTASASGTPFASVTPTFVGNFVIGDLDAVVGNQVTFWSPRWANLNHLSGGSAPHSFKGFARNVTPTPPECGGTWTTTPGNSSHPPDDVPQFIVAIASSSITQNGSTITGDIPMLVLIEVNSTDASGGGGHSLTGTVVGIICGGNATPTPGASASATSTGTPSGTPGGSATPTGTPNGSAPPTGTPNGSATPIGTPNGSATPTGTPNATATPNVSATASGTGTPNSSATPSAPAGSPSATPLLANISTRLRVETGDNVLIGGLIVDGTTPKDILFRASGPSLPVANQLADPILELRDSSGQLIAMNDNWGDATNSQAIANTNIPPANELESAILAHLEPGAYTALVRGANGGTGVAVVEAYDLDQSSSSKLSNISTRGLVQPGDDALIGGVIVTGNSPLRVIIRAIGPSVLTPGVLGDPNLELHASDGTLVAANDNWRSDHEAEIMATGIAPSNDLESAIISELQPGTYTAIVRGANNTAGLALVEVYSLQQQ